MVQTENHPGPHGSGMPPPPCCLHHDESFVSRFPVMQPGMGQGCPPIMGGRRCGPTDDFGRHGRQWVKHMTANKPILTYFDIPGVAEQVRMCFIVGGVPFVDRRITEEEFTKHYKAYSPTGRVPFLEVNGEILVESQALMQFAARRAGLLPSTTEGQLKADLLIEMMADDIDDMRASVPANVARENLRERYIEIMKSTLPAWLDKYEARMKSWVDLEKGETWLVGNRMSYGDVCLVASIYRTQSMTGEKIFPDAKKYPVLSKVYSAVMSLPTVAAYVRERQKTTEKPMLHHTGQGVSRAIEWALKVGHIEYEEKIVAKEEAHDLLEEKSPNGQLPMLEVGGEKFAESVAILQYVAERADLVPLDDFSAAHALAIVKVCSEVWSLGKRIKQKEGDERKKAIEEAVAVTLPEILSRIEEVIGQQQDREGHVVGKKLTYADLWVAQTVEIIQEAHRLHGVKVGNLEYLAPNMFKTHRMVMEVPEVSQHERDSMIAVKPVLTYFDFPGRGESIRYAMLIAGIDFEDRRITREEWANVYKAMSPTGQCPFLAVDKGQVITEAKAILQWVCEVKPQLKPTSSTGRIIAEQLVASWSRVEMALRKKFEVPEEKRAANAPRIRDEFVIPALEIQENLWKGCSTHEGYSVGDKITWVDCWVAGEIECLKYHGVISDDWQEKFPTLAQIHRHVTSHEKVVEYRAMRV